jgi:predicted CXXCH cytochrome family protein
MPKNKLRNAILLFSVAWILSGCDPITRHKVMSTIFDGYPTLPPPEQICMEYADKRVAAMKDELEGKKKAAQNAPQETSMHNPYQEKRCNDCHDRSKGSGFVTATKQELCYACHTDFVKGSFVHGPVAVADCLACHVPHSSSHAPLLKAAKGELCVTCHREKRLTAAMHDKVSALRMICVDCHDPHYGNVQYFLK